MCKSKVDTYCKHNVDNEGRRVPPPVAPRLVLVPYIVPILSCSHGGLGRVDRGIPREYRSGEKVKNHKSVMNVRRSCAFVFFHVRAYQTLGRSSSRRHRCRTVTTRRWPRKSDRRSTRRQQHDDPEVIRPFAVKTTPRFHKRFYYSTRAV